jgi:hypothetical protein
MKQKQWLIVSVETDVEWPVRETEVRFRGHTLILRPDDEGNAADVRIMYDHPDSLLQAYETICRFLSTLSWRHGRPARVRLTQACSTPTLRLGKGGYGPPKLKDYRIAPGLATPSDPKVRIAVALYREAVSIRNPSYEFLGYFKIINTSYDKRPDQVKWINQTIPLLTDPKAKQRFSVLATSHADIGDYLYRSGRCAVAHAFNTPVVDPDEPKEVMRLMEDMPVARALAEYLIEKEYGITRT